jgi:hypothetical protein
MAAIETFITQRLTCIIYLFNDAVSSWEYISSNGRAIIEKLIKESVEVAVAYLQALYRYFSSGTEEIHKGISFRIVDLRTNILTRGIQITKQKSRPWTTKLENFF